VKKHLGTIVKFALSLGLGLLIVWFTFSRLSDEEMHMMRQAFASANYWWLLLGGVFNLASNYFRTERWRMLLKPLGQNPGFSNTFFSIIVMYFANLLFPRLGEVARCGILNKYEKIPVNKSIGTLVTERFMDILMLPLIAGILILVEKEQFVKSYYMTKEITGKFNNSPVYSYILYGVVAAVVLFILFKVITDRTWVQRIRDFIKGIFTGLKSIQKTENPIMFIVHSIGIWAFYWAAAYVSFFALPETASLSVWAALGAIFFGAFAYTAVQGGVGAYPLVLQMIITTYGVSSIIGLSAGWLIWTVQTGIIIIAGTFSLIILSVINKE
jgi:glycosyltransferase 2 family protein